MEINKELITSATVYLCRFCWEAYSEPIQALDPDEIMEHIQEKHPDLLEPGNDEDED